VYPTYPVYHPPVAVPYYSSGCYGCAAAVAAIAGVAVGAAAASANTAAATSSAYPAGVATGESMAGAPASGTYVMRANYASLPAGSMTIDKNGGTCYLSGNTWFQPSYGANGVFYKVVPAP